MSESGAEDRAARSYSIAARRSAVSVDGAGAGAAAVAVPASASVGFAVVQPLTTKTIANTARRIRTALKELFMRSLGGSVFL